MPFTMPKITISKNDNIYFFKKNFLYNIWIYIYRYRYGYNIS